MNQSGPTVSGCDVTPRVARPISKYQQQTELTDGNKNFGWHRDSQNLVPTTPRTLEDLNHSATRQPSISNGMLHVSAATNPTYGLSGSEQEQPTIGRHFGSVIQTPHPDITECRPILDQQYNSAFRHHGPILGQKYNSTFHHHGNNLYPVTDKDNLQSVPVDSQDLQYSSERPRRQTVRSVLSEIQQRLNVQSLYAEDESPSPGVSYCQPLVANMEGHQLYGYSSQRCIYGDTLPLQDSDANREHHAGKTKDASDKQYHQLHKYVESSAMVETLNQPVVHVPRVQKNVRGGGHYHRVTASDSWV
jgi:hypothetical protein